MGPILQLYLRDVKFASDGIEALKIYENEHIDLLILDHLMPKMNGLNVASKIREKNNAIPIIFLSNHKEVSDLLFAIKLNLVEYILKPISLEKLEETFYKVAKNINDKSKAIINKHTIYDYNRKLILNNNLEINLTSKESMLFELLLEKKGAIATKDEIEEYIWNGCMNIDSLRSLIRRLKIKLNDNIIENVHNLGYKLNIDFNA